MRSILILLMFSAVVCSTVQALTWSKKTYSVPRANIERGDFNGDGRADLLLYGNGGTVVMLNAGDGTFDTTHISVTNQLTNVALLDFNRDGKLDVAGCDGSGNLLILLGGGDGTLTVSKTIADGCAWVTAADFNGDGNPDIAVGVPSPNADSSNNQVIVYLGDGHGAISSQVVNSDVDFVADDGDACTLGGSAQAADFTGDKVADIAIAAPCTQFQFEDSALVLGQGDGTGHFTFTKAVDYPWSAGAHLRLDDVDQDGRHDLIAIATQSFPFANDATALVTFMNNGSGTFLFKELAQVNLSDGFGDTMTAGTVADFDGDGTQDVMVAVDTFNENKPTDTFSLRFYKGQHGGTYASPTSFPLSNNVRDMIWGDFDRDGRADSVLARPSSTDVWLNTTAGALTCPADPALRSVHLCMRETSATGDFHLIANPSDNLPVSSVQIYVDGLLRLKTANDLFNINLKLSDGQHRITAKAWDSLGSFSTSKFVNVPSSCDNSNDRTVRICQPVNGGTSNSPVRILANVATSKPFKSIQVYVDGGLRFKDTVKFIDIFTTMPAGLHRVTVKGWDSVGQFSSSVTVNVPE